MKFLWAALVGVLAVPFGADAGEPHLFRTLQDANAFRDMGRCQDLFNAMHDDAAYRRAKAAHVAKQYTFWPAETRVSVTAGQMSDVFVMARDQKGRSGCIASAWLAPVK